MTGVSLMHEAGTQSQCSGTTQRDGVGRDVGGGTGRGADSCQYMAKTITML